MSKIYEALQRAEQERVSRADQGERAPQDVGERKFSRLVSLDTLEPAADFPPHLAADPVEVNAFETLSAAASLPLPLEVHAWQPQLERLPALQSGGGKIEQFRSLRSKLTGLRHAQQFKSIFVGSAHAGEGKSFIASNLAITIARHKSAQVLLIDGDLRRGTLHKIFGCSNEIGLAEYLNNKATISETLQRGRAAESGEPLPSGLANLTVCPCGHAGDRAAELSGSPRFPELMRSMAERFDWIIVDSSPVNVVSDGVNLARSCDSSLLVVRGGETKFETAQRAVRELKSAKLLGVVLNAVDKFAPNEGNYGYQGYESSDE